MADNRLLLATNNAHKVRELRRLLGHLGLDLLTPDDVGLSLDVVEDGDTYEANALAKARAFADASGLPALADDSGIEVDALGGRPGLHSARYGGSGLTDEGRVALLLRELADVGDGERTARYRAVLAVASPATGSAARSERTAEGSCEGTIARVGDGAHGFGYDPVFVVPALGVTMARLTDEEKDAISHRGNAARAMAPILAAWPLAALAPGVTGARS
ncbi:MAG: RdgB/HAM1 family non-canonical purine NTP pyrophosphatase [Chloroflexi bacterium]|nr:RdgB/HAM1 family non-canonical purine NTP pyrophosphatase [Chloroflexota bacterium]